MSYCLAHLEADVVRLVQDLPRPQQLSKVWTLLWSQLCGCTLAPSERFHSGGYVLFNLEARTTQTGEFHKYFTYVYVHFLFCT